MKTYTDNFHVIKWFDDEDDACDILGKALGYIRNESVAGRVSPQDMLDALARSIRHHMTEAIEDHFMNGVIAIDDWV